MKYKKNPSLKMERLAMTLPMMAAVLAMAFSVAMPSNADISVRLSAPKWSFLLDNQPWSASEANLKASENNFARSIQPLLADKNHEAILAAFENRNIEDDSAALRLLRGQVLLSLKHNKKAEEALLSALRLMPKLALAHRSLSMVYMLDKNYEAAAKHLSQTIELGIADAQVYGQLAFVNLQLNHAASALAGYEYALFLEPKNKQWQQGLLYALIQTQAFDQAQALLEELLQADPNNKDLWLQRGQIALNQGRTQQAIASLEHAIALDGGARKSLSTNEKSVSENPAAENIVTVAQLHIQDGSPQRAVDLLAAKPNALIKAGKIEAFKQIAAWLAYQQDWKELARLMASLDGETVPAAYRSHFSVYRAQIALAPTLGASSEPASKSMQAKAKQYLRAAIEDDPANGEALLSLANLLAEQKRSDQALMYFTRAEALPDFSERALLGRAQLEIDRQNYSQALKLLRRVVQVNPTRSDLLANIHSLENLLRSQG